MGNGKVIGVVANIHVAVNSLGHIQMHQDDDMITLSVLEAAQIAILLDEAIALAKGEGVKLDKGLD